MQRIGELSAALESAQGANQHRSSDGTKLETLATAGLSRTEAHRCEQVARVPEAVEVVKPQSVKNPFG